VPFSFRIAIVIPSAFTISKWVKCRQRRPPFFLNPFLTESRRQEVPSEKGSTGSVEFWQQGGWLSQHFNLSAVPNNFRKSFFPQAATLPALRLR
jgi:hypothetical protein